MGILSSGLFSMLSMLGSLKQSLDLIVPVDVSGLVYCFKDNAVLSLQTEAFNSICTVNILLFHTSTYSCFHTNSLNTHAFYSPIVLLLAVNYNVYLSMECIHNLMLYSPPY